jgi:hypothetical protein
MPNILNKTTPILKSNSVRSFIKDVGLPFNKAPEALGLSSVQFMDWWCGRKNNLLNNRHILTLSQYLNIDEDQILAGTYDKNFIRNQLFIGSRSLPEKYSFNQFSNTRTSAHIQRYLIKTRGQHFSDKILRKLNISPLIYENHDNKISLNYFVDLLDVLSLNGFSNEELDSLACMIFLTLDNTLLGAKFKKAKNYFDCYSVLSENILLFDSNFEYTFEVDRNQTRAITFLSFEKHWHMKWDTSQLAKLLRYRQLLISWMPYLSNLPPIMAESHTEHMKDGIQTIYTIRHTCESETRPLFLVPRPKDFVP